MSCFNSRNSEDSSVLNTQEKLSLESWGLPSSIVHGYAEKGIHQMFPWQVECLTKEGVLQGKNLVYTAPTSAGKTMVAEVLMMKSVLERKKKVLFILPFVSVVREKVHYFQKLYKGVGIKVDGWMGSYSPPGGVKSVNVMIATIEKANNIINRLIEENKLERLGCIVVDELHMLGDPGRGYLLELLLTKLKYMHHMNRVIQVQVIGMSATLPNLNVLARWLDAVLFYSNYRPIPLVEHLVLDSTAYILPSMKPSCELKSLLDLPGQNEDVMYLCLDSILNGHSVLIFCPSKNWCETLANKISSVVKKIGLSNSDIGLQIRARLDGNAVSDILQQLSQCPVGMDAALKKSISFGVGFHHAGLTMHERDIVECGFRQGTLKVLVSTSTLSSGVNLPARRVILRSPRHLDILTYKQMVGRAGRMGKDSAGESYLLCDKSEETAARALVSAKLPPVQSCLGKSDLSECLKRALLEVIACGIVTSLEQVILYTQCTLFAVTCKSNDNLLQCIHACVDYLRSSQFLVLTESNDLIPSSLARATLAASIPPEISLRLLSELTRARQCFVLDSELHVIYEITPYSVSEQWGDLDWMKCLSLWENMSASCKRVAELVGCDRVEFLHKVQVRPAYAKSEEGRKLLSVFKRFYTALALQDIVNEMSLTEVADKYGCNKGMLQSLQQSASTFAGMVTQFCRKLGWSGFEPLVSQFCARLEFGVQSELVSLLQISLLNSLQARALYDAGFETLADIANASVTDILRVLQRAVPFQARTDGRNPSVAEHEKKMFVNGEDCLTEYEAAVAIIHSARSLIEQHLGVDNIEWNNKNLNESDSELTYTAVTPTIRLKKSEQPVSRCDGGNKIDEIEISKHEEKETSRSKYALYVEKSCRNKTVECLKDEVTNEISPNLSSTERGDDSKIVSYSNRVIPSSREMIKPITPGTEESCVSKAVSKAKARISLTDLFNESTDDKKNQDPGDNLTKSEKISKENNVDKSEDKNKENVSTSNCSGSNKKRLSLDLFDSSDEDDLIEEDKTIRENLNRTLDAFDANLGGESLLEMSLKQMPTQYTPTDETRRKSRHLKKKESLKLSNEISKINKNSEKSLKRKSASKNSSNKEADIWNRFRKSLSLDSSTSDKGQISSGFNSPDLIGQRKNMDKILVEDTMDCDIMSSNATEKADHVNVPMNTLTNIDSSTATKTNITSNSSNEQNKDREVGKSNTEKIYFPEDIGIPKIAETTAVNDVEMEQSMFDSSFPRCTLIEKEILSKFQPDKRGPALQEIFLKPKLPPLKKSNPNEVGKKFNAPTLESKAASPNIRLLDGSFPNATLLENEILNLPNKANEKLTEASRIETAINTPKIGLIIATADIHQLNNMSEKESSSSSNHIEVVEKNVNSKIKKYNMKRNINTFPEAQADNDSIVIDSSIAYSKPRVVQQDMLKVKDLATTPLLELTAVGIERNPKHENQSENIPKALSMTECFESQFPNMTAIEREMRIPSNENRNIEVVVDSNSAMNDIDETVRVPPVEANTRHEKVIYNMTVDNPAGNKSNNHTSLSNSSCNCNSPLHKTKSNKANNPSKLTSHCEQINQNLKENENMIANPKESNHKVAVQKYRNKVRSSTIEKDLYGKVPEDVSFANDSDFIDDKLCLNQSTYKTCIEQTQFKINPTSKESIASEGSKLKNRRIGQKSQFDSDGRHNSDQLESPNGKLAKTGETPQHYLTIENSSSDEDDIMQVTVRKQPIKDCLISGPNRRDKSTEHSEQSTKDDSTGITLEIDDTMDGIEDDFWQKLTVVKENRNFRNKDSARLMKTPSTSRANENDLFNCKTSRPRVLSPLTSKTNAFTSKTFGKNSTTGPECSKSHISSPIISKTNYACPITPTMGTESISSKFNTNGLSTSKTTDPQNTTSPQRRQSLSNKDVSSLFNMSQRFKSINENLFSTSPPSPTSSRPNQESTPTLETSAVKRKLPSTNKSVDKRRKLNGDNIHKATMPTNLTGLVFNATAVSFCNVLDKSQATEIPRTFQTKDTGATKFAKDNRALNVATASSTVEECGDVKHRMLTRARRRLSDVEESNVNATGNFDGTITQIEKANKYRAEFIQLFKNNAENQSDKDILEELNHIDSLALSFKCVASNSQDNVIGTKVMKKQATENPKSGKSKFLYKNKQLILMYLVWTNDVTYFVDLVQAESLGFKLLSSLVSNPELSIYLCHAKSTCIFLQRCCQLEVRAQLIDPIVADWLIAPGTEVRTLRTIVKGHFKECAGLCNMFGSLVNQPAEEALVMWKLRPFLESKLEQMNLWHHFIETEMPIQKILTRAELLGVGFNVAHISSLNDKVIKVMSALEKQIHGLAGRRFNLRSPKDWAVVKAKLNLGQRTDHEIIKIRRQWHQLDSLHSRCLQNLLFKHSITNCDVTPLATDDIMGSNRIHTQFSTHSQTGRIFTVRPNLQTTPKDLNICGTLFDPRNAIVSADQCVLICADFKQIELRVLTHLSQDAALKAAIESEDDVFKSIAAQWHKIPLESVSEERRNQTKSICYAIIYGMGPRSLASKLEITLEEAADLYSSFKRKYSEIEIFCHHIVEQCRHDGYVKTLGHRRRYIEDINSSDNKAKGAAERQAVNTCIQGSAADIVKAAMIQTESVLTKSQCSARLVLQIHDELIFEVPESEVPQACSLIRRGMEHCIQLSLQLPISIKIGTSWGNAKSI